MSQFIARSPRFMQTVATALMCCCALLFGTGAQATNLYAQRAAYKAALDHLTAGRSAEFRKSRQELADYPLAPYLDYYALQSRLSSVSAAEVVGFRSGYPDLPVSDILYTRWLKRLGSQRKWQALLDHFEPANDAELRCYHLRALLATNEADAAYSQVPYLWISAHSQPKACDPLFDAWIAAGNLTEAMVWERLTLAIQADNRTLARYLLRFFTSPAGEWAESFYNVHIKPEAVTSNGRFRADTELSRTVIAHGLQRLSTKDPEAASKSWLKYQDSHNFNPVMTRDIDASLLVGHAQQERWPPQDNDLPAETLTAAAPGMAKAAVEKSNWSEAVYWIEHLDDAARAERLWQYWLARALDESVLNSQRARLAFAALSARRDYYGFLSAERIGVPPQLNDQSISVSPSHLMRLQGRPAVRRATELYAVGDMINARREWYRLVPELEPAEQAAAATLASDLGWTSQSIFTANTSGLHDAVDLRFPIVYRQQFNRISHVTTVPESFLLAVARQESAFDPEARSPANARGLMQLMQPTAEHVARRIGLPPPSASDLYDSALNIQLGGHHLAALMERYDNRRPLVAAAYNAGEHRVDRWIRDASGTDMDVWIETIPFRETRDYVKNVLAFALVYAHRLGTPTPMLEIQEARLP